MALILVWGKAFAFDNWGSDVKDVLYPFNSVIVDAIDENVRDGGKGKTRAWVDSFDGWFCVDSIGFGLRADCCDDSIAGFESVLKSFDTGEAYATGKKDEI